MSVNAALDPSGVETFRENQQRARAGRAAFAHSPDSAFVRAMQGAISQYLKARDQGVNQEDGIRGIEEELRACWPKSVSKFVPECDACDDTGYRELTCWDRQQCGRKVCAANPERQHLYMVPCDCAKGGRMRERVKHTDDGIAAAARTPKRKSGGWRQAGQ